jgi:hypothetical protein
MTALELVFFAAAIASLTMAVVAIALSIVFYKMSSYYSERADEAAKDIGASVSKLEKLFDRLYSDTFSMVKESYSDMRKHAWGESAAETPDILEAADKQAEAKIDALRKEIGKQVGEVLKGQKLADGQIVEISSQLNQLVNNAIDDSRNVEHEAREETIRESILKLIRMRSPRRNIMRAVDIVGLLSNEFPQAAILQELRHLRRDNLTVWEGNDLSPNTEIRLLG